MSKDDERILCIPKSIMSKGEAAGYNPVQTVLRAVGSPIAAIRRRGDVETDETLLQPIPYVVLIAPFGEEGDSVDASAAKVLLYQRSSKGGEKRLEHQYSIGIGGHVNEEDVQMWFERDDDFDSPMDACIARELSEELGLPGGIGCNVFLSPSVIYKEDEAVSRVHVGLNYFMVLNEVPKLSVENTLENVKWVDIDDITPGGQYFDQLEGWSKEVGIGIRAMFAMEGMLCDEDEDEDE